MKVEQLIKMLEKSHKPTDDICVLWWDKPSDELSEEGWTEICLQFDEWEDAGLDISEWIADAVAEREGVEEDY